MSTTTTTSPTTISLPSDQDSSGRTLGEEEIAAVTKAIKSGTLTSTKGEFVKTLEEKFAKLTGTEHCHACASGSAAVHTAVAAINPDPGEEIITTAITDMGALTAILYQAAIPVFADICPSTYNVTAETIEAQISERTRAIIVTHLFGNPCDMDPIMELARKHQIPIIEDAAQAYGTTYKGQPVGSIGDIGCFSLQQGKHITTGEGGLCVTNDENHARRIFLFINKAWGYGDAKPDHYFLAPNYRLTELQGAVAVAQLDKLEGVVTARQQSAAALTTKIADLAPRGISTPEITPGGSHSYWKYCLNVNSDKIPDGAARLAGLLRERGIFSAPSYIQKPAFRCEVIAKQRTFGRSRFPFNLARREAVDYAADRYPGSFRGLADILVLPWNERYTNQHVDFIADAIHQAADQLAS